MDGSYNVSEMQYQQLLKTLEVKVINSLSVTDIQRQSRVCAHSYKVLYLFLKKFKSYFYVFFSCTLSVRQSCI